MESKIFTQSNSNKNLKQKFKKSICLIKYKKKMPFPGIFCKLPFAFNDKTYFILIINNIYLDKEEISLDNEIKIILNDVNDKPKLKIDNSRIIYRENKKDGITIIEIKESDGLDINSFLDIDTRIVLSEPKDTYVNNDAYLINNQYNKKPEFLQIIIKNIYNEKYEIKIFDSKKIYLQAVLL